MLAELGIGDGTRLMLVSPPDAVLAEAGRLSPRPSFASSIMTAEPTGVLVWWPETETLNGTTLARLAWMAANAHGLAWVVLDPREGTPSAGDLEPLLREHSLRVTEHRAIGPVTALSLAVAAG